MDAHPPLSDRERLRNTLEDLGLLIGHDVCPQGLVIQGKPAYDMLYVLAHEETSLPHPKVFTSPDLLRPSRWRGDLYYFDRSGNFLGVCIEGP